MMKNELRYWLIAYDICDGRRLAQVVKCLSSYGWRIQNSIFEANANVKTIKELRERLNRILKDDDSVLIVPICENDRKKRKVFGMIKGEDPMSDATIVL